MIPITIGGKKKVMSDKSVDGRKKLALGKGLSALLGDTDGQYPSRKSSDSSARVLKVNPNLIDPNPQQPRTVFKPQDLENLCDSVRTNGIIQPLIVAKQATGNRYMLIAGERRLRAALAAKLEFVPVILRDVSSEELLRVALIENIQRSDLNIIEEAVAYEKLINDYGLTQEQCAQRVGKDRSTIANLLRVLSLPKRVQDDLSSGQLTFGHAKVLLSLDSEALILRARELIVKKALSVRQTDRICKLLKEKKASTPEKGEDPDLKYLADNLREHLRTKVRLQGTGNRGRIEISYFSASELERVLEIIGP